MFKTSVSVYKNSKLVGGLANQSDIKVCERIDSDLEFVIEEKEYKYSRTEKCEDSEFRYIRFGWYYPTPFAKNCSLWNDINLALKFDKEDDYFDIGSQVFDMKDCKVVASESSMPIL